jgi:hypothetical protein
MPLGRKPRRQESALYLQLLVDRDIHCLSSVLLICTGGQLSQHRDYGEITGGQNALSPDSVN